MLFPANAHRITASVCTGPIVGDGWHGSTKLIPASETCLAGSTDVLLVPGQGELCVPDPTGGPRTVAGLLARDEMEGKFSWVPAF